MFFTPSSMRFARCIGILTRTTPGKAGTLQQPVNASDNSHDPLAGYLDLSFVASDTRPYCIFDHDCDGSVERTKVWRRVCTGTSVAVIGHCRGFVTGRRFFAVKIEAASLPATSSSPISYHRPSVQRPEDNSRPEGVLLRLYPSDGMPERKLTR